MRRATYRVQLRAGFDFDRAAGIVAYLDDLGVSDLYCSPLLQAAPGSTHGYDVVDHSRLSAQLGGDAGFERLGRALQERSLGLTVDIVPNHMAIDGRANRWWWDVLENGPSSLYAGHFDIDWPGGDSSRHEPTVLVPVLGDRYGRVVDAGEVRVRRDGGSFSVVYFDHELPLSPRTIDDILTRAAGETGSELLAELAAGFAALPHATATDPPTVRLRHDEKERLADRLAALCRTEDGVAGAIDRQVERVNSDPDDLDRLLRRQNYRLAFWRTAREELDYRRFFNIETLVGLRVEDEQVFADTHEIYGRLIRDGQVSGLRVDHVDGLRDPGGYLQRLRRLAPSSYTVVEKILGEGEQVPDTWPVEGTTGYDFITRIANVFVDPAGEEQITSTYTGMTGEPGDYAEVVRAAKQQIMREELAPEVERLTRLLHTICDGHRSQRDRTRGEVRDALHAILASFPVYRTYIQPDRPRLEADVVRVREAVDAAVRDHPDADPELLGFIGELLILDRPGAAETEFAQMFPQVSAPVMAKGAEDTAFYRYNRLVSLNEVGGDPGRFGRPLAAFHADTARSAAHWGRSMLSLATHDTKRSPDVRARIGLLSELAGPWDAAVRRWMEITDRHAGPAGPDPNTRYLLFQTLVGTWPIGTDRLVAYMEKAAREAKVHTSWADGDAEYEGSVRKFVESSLADSGFVAELEGFLARHSVVETARATSLSMTALLLTCPGIPDIYQGTETWDHSLVDPDNRRPVDFAALAARLAGVSGWGPDALASGSADPDLAKLWLTARLLGHRRRRPEAYSSPSYQELSAHGSGSDHLVAFAREDLVVLAGRHLARLGSDWAGTAVELPAGRWRAVIGASPADMAGGAHPVEALLGRGPVAVLERA